MRFDNAASAKIPIELYRRLFIFTIRYGNVSVNQGYRINVTMGFWTFDLYRNTHVARNTRCPSLAIIQSYTIISTLNNNFKFKKSLKSRWAPSFPVWFAFKTINFTPRAGRVVWWCGDATPTPPSQISVGKFELIDPSRLFGKNLWRSFFILVGLFEISVGKLGTNWWFFFISQKIWNFSRRIWRFRSESAMWDKFITFFLVG